MVWLFVVTMIGSVGTLVLAVWPGALDQGCLCICVTLPLLVLCLLLLTLSVVVRDLNRKPAPSSRGRWAVLSVVAVVGTVGLVRYHIPQRIAFAAIAGSMHSLAQSAPLAHPEAIGYDGFELDRRFGPYRVGRYAADPRGGVYFRTLTGADGIGPDRMSYGFAFQPNHDGTPFGMASYRLDHLFGAWYVFEASNDY